MRSREYWKRRAIAFEYYAQQDATKTLDKINRLFGTALENIDAEIKSIRQELGKQTGIVSENELNELLNTAKRDKSYRELQELLALAETEEERIDIMNRINAQAYGARITRADSIGNKILAEFTKAAVQEKILCRELFSSTYADAFYGNIYNLAEGYNAGVAFDILPRRAINKALNEPWNGDSYSGRIWKHGREFTEQVEETVIKGLMTGRSRAKLASELTEYTEHTRYVAERLVRTETSHFLGEGQKEAYKAAGIEKYRYLAALSERTCDICAALDNKVFLLDEATEGVNYPPMHPNCRCITITADAELKERLARDPETSKNYRVDGNMNFQQWKDSLSDEQRVVMSKYVDNSAKSGIIKARGDSVDMRIDKFTPCLENAKTGEILQTSFSIASKNDLSHLNGWNFDWTDSSLKKSDIYKLTVKDDDTIQGLIALTKFDRDKAMYVSIVESAPHNLGVNKQYNGVGGHLYAIAVQKSVENGYGGFVFMDAKNLELVEHYQKTLGATWLGRPHQYRMFINEDAAQKLLQIYTLRED